MMIEDEIGYGFVGQLIVAGPRLRIDESEVFVVAPVEVLQVTELDTQHTDHLLVLGSADQTAIGDGDPSFESASQELAQRRSGSNGVGVWVVVRQHEPASSAGALLEILGEFREALASLIGNHGELILLDMEIEERGVRASDDVGMLRYLAADAA
jgi:hypothetical protein